MADSTLKPCPFCALPEERIVVSSGLAMEIRGRFPASPGHTLIIPHWHVVTFFDATIEKQVTDHDA